MGGCESADAVAVTTGTLVGKSWSSVIVVVAMAVKFGFYESY